MIQITIHNNRVLRRSMHWRSTLTVIGIVCSLLASFGASYPQSGKDQLSFNFPGDQSRSVSAVGQFSAEYKQSVKSQDDFIFLVKDQSRKAVAEHAFSRSVEGAWSQTAANLYLNDFLGSTQIDCFVWTPQSRGLSSLTEALLRDPQSGPIEGRGAKPPETPQNSRFELTCDGWKSKDKVLVNVEGTTWAGGQFKYKLVYDLMLKRFSWN